MWQKEKKTAAAVLLMAALFLAVTGLLVKGGDRAEKVRGKIQDAAAAAGKPVYEASAGLREGARSILQFKARMRERENLQQQLNLLRKENADLRLEASEYRELQELSRIFSYDTIEYGNVQAANVITTYTSRWMHNFTIDRGKSSGIEAGDPVIAGDGLIGRVSEVSERYAKVVSLLDEKNKVSFHAEKDPELLGLLWGDGKGGLEGYLLGNEGFVKKGERLKTSGVGSYPKGFLIGEVTRVEKGCGQQRIRLKAVPAADPAAVKKSSGDSMSAGKMMICFAAAFFVQAGSSTGPDLILCFLVIFSIIGEEKAAVPLMAAAAALIADIGYGQFPGAAAAAVLTVGFLLTAVTGQINGWNPQWILLLTAAAVLAENLMIWGIASWLGSPYRLTYILRWTAGQMVCSAAASLLIYCLIDRGGKGE